MARLSGISANLNAFLDLIAFSEGTSGIPGSDDGYKVIVGSTPRAPMLMTDYNGHPRRKVFIPSLGVWSTAAGRYQLIARTWDVCQKALKLADFSPESQDKAAVFLIQGRKALEDVGAGRIADAIMKCGREWASFPGNTYGQHPHAIEGLVSVYKTLGGTIRN